MNLTDEQRAALEATCQIFQAAIDGEKGKPLTAQVALLVGINSIIGSMLSQSCPAWQITKERKEALDLLCNLASDHEFRYAEIENEANRVIELIRDMLAEAEGKI